MNEIILIIVLFVAICIGIIVNSKKARRHINSVEDKKYQIVNDYKIRLNEILDNTNVDDLSEKKMQFLKDVNSELARNIYFTQEEISIIIKDLASYEVKNG